MYSCNVCSYDGYFYLQINGGSTPSLFVGARLVRHYRFVGEIMDVVVFNSLISGTFVAQLQNDYSQVSDPMGQCVPYLSHDQPCPSPAMANSLLCQSVSQMSVAKYPMSLILQSCYNNIIAHNREHMNTKIDPKIYYYFAK